MIFKTKIGQIQEVNRKYGRKTEYATKYVFRERGITIHPPYKNFVLKIS